MPEKQSSTESKSGSGSSGKTAKQSNTATSKDPSQSKESSVAKETVPAANDAQSQVQALVDRRIRNLEKRKARLETLRQEAENGKELNEDQKKAVSKYEDVLESLEFLRDFTKSMAKIFADTQAARRKIEKEEQAKRQREEKERLRNILLFRDLLFTVHNENDVRSKLLLQGESSPQDSQKSETAMSVDKLKHFDELLSLVTPDRKKGDSFKAQLETAADRLISLADGKKKEFVKGITYSEMKATLLSIEKSGLLTSVASTTSTGKGSKKQQTSASPGKTVSSSSSQSANTNVPTGLIASSDGKTQQSANTMATNVAPLQPQAPQPHISFGSHGADGRPEQDPAVVGIIPSYPGGSATIPSQVFTNPNYHPQNVFVPPTFINAPYVVQGIIPPVTQPQQSQQQSQPLQAGPAGGTMNGQGILPTPDTLPESNSGDYVTGMAGLNINDASNHVTMVNSQLQTQQTGHIQKVPGDSEFRRRDPKAQFNTQFPKRNINDGRNNPKVFEHHGSSKSFQRNKNERYQGNSRDLRNGGGNFGGRAGTSNRGPHMPTAATGVSGGPAGAFNKAGPK